MGIILNSIGQGLGQGMMAIGQQMAANDQAQSRIEIERERLRQEREMRLEEIKARWDEGATDRAGMRGKKEDITDELLRKYPEAFGVETTLPKQDDFKKEVVTKTGTTDIIDTNGGQYTDAVSRKTAQRTMETEQRPDTEAYGKAKKGIIESNIRNVARVANPDKYDDLEKGNAQAAVNRLGEMAMSETDPARREQLVQDANKLAIALGGKERFKVQGNTVVDTATGSNKATDVGESIVTKNERPPAAKGGSGKPDNTGRIEDGKDARALVASIERELRAEKANMSKVSSKEKPAVQARISKLESELDAARSRIASGSKPAGDTSPKAGDNPARAETVARPATKAEFDALPKGARYINPADGKTYVKK